MSNALIWSGLLAVGAPSMDVAIVDGLHRGHVQLEHRSVTDRTRFERWSTDGVEVMSPPVSSCWVGTIGDDLVVVYRRGDVFDGLRIGDDGSFAVRGDETALHVGQRVRLPTGLVPCGHRDGVRIASVRAGEEGGPDAPPRINASDACREVRVAIETDWAFTQLFNGDVDDAGAYVASLMAAVSAIFQRDLNVVLTPSYVRIWADDSDPYDASEAELNYLDQFAEHWISDSPVEADDRHLAHLLSGEEALTWAGYAWVGSTCSTTVSYAYSSSLEGGWWSWNPWDLFVVTHEIGHSLGADHTHEMSPPIDNCGSGDCAGAENGTIMSYCHTCPGGYDNVSLVFHPLVRQDVWAHLTQREQWGQCDIAVDRTADVDGDGDVAWGDLEQVLSDWSSCGCCAADVDESGGVDVGDVLAVLEAWTGMPG